MKSSTSSLEPDASRLRHEPTPSRARGFSIIEVLVSLVVLIIGLLGLMRVTSVAVVSNQRGQRMDQAVARAQTRLEALRNVPTAALACLEAGTNPSSCLSTCQAAGGDALACQTALAQDADAATDSTGTGYTYGFLVQQPNPGVYDILVLVTFTDDSSEPARQVRTYFRTAVYRPQ